MSSEVAIEFKNVTKQYSLHGGLRTVKNMMDRIKNGQLFSPVVMQNDFFALKNVSFTLNQGERLGIIGPNGAGKSTTLKLINQITYPTSGEINITGSVGGLIELGAGFHPDLSGYDNIFLNTAIYGYSKKETLKFIDKIVDISELGAHIHLPLKRYSSGMKVRLGFAVAMTFTPDIVLLDEVLAVGDMNFKKKAMKILDQYLAGKTIVFVSHSLKQVTSLCQRVIVISNGEIFYDGKPDTAVKLYTELVEPEKKRKKGEVFEKEFMPGQIKRGFPLKPLVEIINVEFLEEKELVPVQNIFDRGKKVLIRIEFKKSELKNSLTVRTRVTKKFVGDLTETIAGASVSVVNNGSEQQHAYLSFNTSNLVDGYYLLELFARCNMEDQNESFFLFKVDFKVSEISKRNYIGLVNLEFKLAADTPTLQTALSDPSDAIVASS